MEKYPLIEKKGSQVNVQVRLYGQQNWRKAMFHWNGGKPVFASYGSDVTDSVEEWDYIPKEE